MVLVSSSLTAVVSRLLKTGQAHILFPLGAHLPAHSAAMTLNNKTKTSVERVPNGHRRAGSYPGSGSYITDTRPRPRICGYVRRLSRSTLNALHSEEKR